MDYSVVKRSQSEATVAELTNTDYWRTPALAPRFIMVEISLINRERTIVELFR